MAERFLFPDGRTSDMPAPAHREIGMGRSSLFFLFYLLVFGFLARGWLGQAFTAIPRDLHTDGWFIYWVLGWVGDALTTAPGSIFDPPINWPAKNQLAGSEHFVTWQLSYLPLRTLLGSELAALNLTFFLAYVLAAWLAALLLLQLGCSVVVAGVGGLLYGSADVAFGSSAMPHVVQIANLFLPLIILCLVRLRASPSAARTLVLWAALVLGFLSSYYMAVLLVFLGAMWGCFELARPGPARIRYLITAVVAAGAAGAVVLAFSLPYFDRPEAEGDPDRVVSMWQVGHLVGETATDHGVGLHKSDAETDAAEEEAWVATWELRKLALARAMSLVRALLIVLALAALATGRCPLPRAAIGGLVLVLGGAFVSLPALLPVGGDLIESPIAYLLRHSPARFVRQTLRLSPIWFLGTVVLTAVGLEVVRSWRSKIPFVVVLVLVVATEIDRRLDPVTRSFLRESNIEHVPQKLLRRHLGSLQPLPHYFRPPMDRSPTLTRDATAYERMRSIIHERGAGPFLEVPADLARGESMVAQRVLGVPSIYFYTGYVPPHTLLVKALASELPAPEPLEDLVGLTGLKWLIVRTDSPRGQRLRRGFRQGIGLDKVVVQKWNIEGKFLLVELSQARKNPHWIQALRDGPKAGMSLLGYPRKALSADELDYQVRVSSPGPGLAGWTSPYAISVLNPGPALTAARPDRPDEDLSVRLHVEWASLEGDREVPKPMIYPLRRDVGSQGYLVQREHIPNPSEPGLYELTVRLEQIGNPAFTTTAPEKLPYRVGSARVVVVQPEDEPEPTSEATSAE